MHKQELLRTIPSVDQMSVLILQKPKFSDLSHPVLVSLLRRSIQRVRQRLIVGKEIPEDFSAERIVELIIIETELDREKLFQPSLRKVINATGVVLHTNLGRAPLSLRARAQVLSVMEGYSTLEYDLVEGHRGERYNHVSQRLEQLTAAEAAIVVNNNAAAVMLVLGSFARNKEVIVSRGELVEIGGSFRIPDVIKQSGALLVEVGTTNKTHLEDYAAAITPNTAVILKVHTSNFEIVGFTARPTMEDLCLLAREKSLMSVNDLGSGTLVPFVVDEHTEPTVQECIGAGFDLVTFSGDKLLGSGQAGIIAGKKSYIDYLKKEPLLRALRIDKLSLAALEGTLIDYAEGRPAETIPGWTMLNKDSAVLQETAEAVVAQLEPLRSKGWTVRVVPTQSLSGGGSLPAVELPGFGVEVIPRGVSVVQVERCLRKCATPIVGLVRDNTLLFDVRCFIDGDVKVFCAELVEIGGGSWV